MSKLAIFPAAGALGGSIYTHLLEWIDPADVILISRHPEKVPSKYLERGLITRKADYNAPESLEGVFDDASCLVLVSYPSLEFEQRVEAHKLAIDAARRSSPGVSHIFYTSLAFGGDCTPNSVACVMQAHLMTEKYLQSLASSSSSSSSSSSESTKPFTFTAIREGIYAQTFPMYTGFFDVRDPTVNEIRIPHDGSGPGIAWAKLDDLGEATARLVQEYLNAISGKPVPASDIPYRNQIVLLSGPKAWTLAETVKLLGEVAGKKEEVRLVQVGLEEHVSRPVYRGKIAPHGRGDPAREWATVFEAVRAGETAVVSPLMARLLGREPEGFEQVVRRTLAQN